MATLMTTSTSHRYAGDGWDGWTPEIAESVIEISFVIDAL
jgi:hypothetical protein